MIKIAEYIKGLKKKKFSNERLLNDSEIEIAKFLGIGKFAKVKVVNISRADFRGTLNEEAVKLLDRFGLVKDSTNAITLGNRIFLFKSDDERRTIAHELVHIYQYEKLGIDIFVQVYLDEYIGKKKNTKIALEVPAYEFGNDFKANGYCLDKINRYKYKIIPPAN